MLTLKHFKQPFWLSCDIHCGIEKSNKKYIYNNAVWKFGIKFRLSKIYMLKRREHKEQNKYIQVD